MKYIVTQREDGTEEIFLFSRDIHHDCFADEVGYMKNQRHGNWTRVYREPISAGFYDGSVCHGRSETLDLDSRGERDTALIRG